MRAIYLDHAATSPIDPRVAIVYARALAEVPGNPHQLAHGPGRAAASRFEEASRGVAAALAAPRFTVVATSGATESNALALGRFVGGRTRHLITTALEHPSVLRPARSLRASGWRVTRLRPDAYGRIDLDDLARAVARGADLVSIQWVNQELGTVHPMAEISRICRAGGARLHSDATQAVGRVAVDARLVDLLTLSGHKIGGPPGIGALLVRRRSDLSRYGVQQHGLRMGTAPVAATTALAASARHAVEERTMRAEAWQARIGSVRQALVQLGAVLLSPVDAAPGLLSFGWPDVDATALLDRCPEVALGTGSACLGRGRGPAPGLRALPIHPSLRRSAVRLSAGPATLARDVDAAIRLLGRAARSLLDSRPPPEALPWSSNSLSA